MSPFLRDFPCSAKLTEVPEEVHHNAAAPVSHQIWRNHVSVFEEDLAILLDQQDTHGEVPVPRGDRPHLGQPLQLGHILL